MLEDTHNYELVALQEGILAMKKYVLALHKRLALVRNGFSLKSEYEKNEVDIVVFETLAKISNANKKIYQLQTEFGYKTMAFLNDLEELNRNFEELLGVAKKAQGDNIAVKHFLYYANWKAINNSVVDKITFYKDLKALMPYEKV